MGHLRHVAQPTRTHNNPQNHCYKLLQISLRATLDTARQSLTIDTSTTKPVKVLYMQDKILDILAAVVIGLALCVGALAYFDVLTK